MKQILIRVAEVFWAYVRYCGKEGWPVAGDKFQGRNRMRLSPRDEDMPWN